MDSKDLYIKSLEETVDRLQKELEDALAREIDSGMLIDTPIAIGNVAVGVGAGVAVGSGHLNTPAIGYGALAGTCISSSGVSSSSGGTNSGCTSAKVPASNTVSSVSAHTSFMNFINGVEDA